MPSVARSEHREQRSQALSFTREFNDTVTEKDKHKEIDLTRDFTKAASKAQDGREGQGSSGGPKPATQSKIRRYGRKRKRDQNLDIER